MGVRGLTTGIWAVARERRGLSDLPGAAFERLEWRMIPRH